MEKKNTLILTIIAIATLIVVVIGATFAYFTATEDATQQIPVGVQTGDAPTFIASSNDAAIELNVTGDKMMEADSKNNPLVDSDTADITVSLTAPKGTKCTYDVVYYDTGASYTASNGLANVNGGKEFTLSITKGGTEVLAETNYDSASVNFASATSTSSVVVLSQESIYGADTETTVTYEITGKFYNLSIAQDGLKNKTFGGNFKVDNVVCKKSNTTTLSDKVLALANGSDYTSSQDGSVYRVANQNGVRYEGADPDNYVEFNGGESWRIIGTFEGSTIGLESGKYYTKIIKSESLGTREWNTTDTDGDGVRNDWTEATLNTYLNGIYKSGLNAISNKMIANATWHLGGTDIAEETFMQQLLAYTPDNFYAGERMALGANGTTEPNKLKHQNYIGLMYPSDYGYAMYAGQNHATCQNTNAVATYGPSAREGEYGLENYVHDCYQYDWLSMGLERSAWEWTISPWSDVSDCAFAVGDGVVGNVSVVSALAVRPALYLDSSVQITGGSGKASDHYTISL